MSGWVGRWVDGELGERSVIDGWRMDGTVHERVDGSVNDC